MLRGELHQSGGKFLVLFLIFPALTENDFDQSDKELYVTLNFIELLNVDSHSDFLKVSISLREDRDNQVE
jgi:hypothetical protein